MRAIWNIAQGGAERQTHDPIWMSPEGYGLVAPGDETPPFDREQWEKNCQIGGLDEPTTAKSGGQTHHA
jgi:hypothetical protein